MYCRYCGQQVDDGMKFCIYCGQPLRPETETAADSPYDPMPEPVATPGVQTQPMPGVRPVANAQPAPERQTESVHFDPVVPRGKATRQPQAPLQAATGKPEKTKGIWTVLAILFAFAVGLAISSWYFRSAVSDGGDGTEDSDQYVVDDVSDSGSTDEAPPAEDDGSVKVQSSLAYYSWEELASIADEIAACSSSSEAVVVAQQYNLVESGGRYTDTTKSITLDDGTSVNMKLVGVWQDKADTTSGRAGLSFLADNIAYQRRMAEGTTTPGGWQGSELRTWLQSDLFELLPDDVASLIMPVYKLSNNAGETTSTSSVTETYDTLWIPSIVELTGPVSWTYFTHPDQADLYNAVFNGEGTQYAAFSQARVVSDEGNQVLALGGDWWMRSTAASTGRGRHVDGSGDPSCFGDSNATHGVVFGFCL